MKKISYIFLAIIAIFVNSTAYGAEARTSATSISKALQNARNKDNFATLKSAKFDVENKIYNITYISKDGNIENVKISQANGKEVK
tara:strand:+ start:89 stop:346 length:258 start_codon:yes stop_codon:yes gene_type:complete